MKPKNICHLLAVSGLLLGGATVLEARENFAAGDRLLVSDTDRQSVLLFDSRTFQPLGQVGVTDVAGTDTDQLHSPGAVALAGDRAVVADTGNQRVVKLRLR